MQFNTTNNFYSNGLKKLTSQSINRDDIFNTLLLWRREAASIQHLIITFINETPIFSDKTKNILKAAAVIAAEPNNNAYHGNAHFTDVTCGAIMLGHKAYSDDHITADQFGLLITSALIHDYKHDGTGNGNEQFRLERLAFESSKARLQEVGATEKDLEILKAFVFTTDVSKDFNDPNAMSPADTVKEYLTSHDKRRDILHSELRILHDINMVDTAQMLQDADVGTIMCSPDYCDLQGFLIAKENKSIEENAMSYDRSGQLNFFIPKIMHNGQIFSKAGKNIIQPWIADVIDYYQKITPVSPVLKL